jgi:ATP-dependent protease ClpP protease subunit
MPLPKPRQNERQAAFISRCMSDDVMTEEYPKPAQRRAVCQSQWEKKDNVKASWYRVGNRTEAEADLFIYDEIGGLGITADAFVRDLRAIKARKINLHINSPGGDIFDAITMHTALKQHAAQVEVHVDGLAASAASLVAMGGDKISMAQHSFMMIHEAHGLVMGAAEDMRKGAILLDQLSDNLAAIYSARAGGTKEEWRERMAVESWYSDEGAVAVGLADEVSDGAAVGNSFDLSAFKRPPEMPRLRLTADQEEEIPPIDYRRLFEEAVEEVI